MKYLVVILIVLMASIANAQVIGQWKDDGAGGIGTDITIYKSGGVYHLVQVFRDGSKSDEKLNKSGSKFTKSGSQDYYVISRSGTLKCYDRQGLIYDARATSHP
jgi:hypothetical protein